MTLKGSQLGWVSRLVYRPGIMFALGAFITLISMSVSISLSLLVPLSQRGFVRRENIIPYIMGANITTFIDTLLASMLLENQSAICIVLVEMVSITIISMIILVVFYSQYQKLLLNFNSWATRSNWNVAISLVVILVVPIVLLVV
jgi:Na+/phosphate symporter